MTASRRAKTRLVIVLTMTVAWTVTGPAARAAACPMREMQVMQAPTVRCHETDDARGEEQRSERDCCKKTGHACCFKAPDRSGTPTSNVSVDAPRVAAVLPAIASTIDARHFVQLPSHRPPARRTALAPPVLRL